MRATVLEIVDVAPVCRCCGCIHTSFLAQVRVSEYTRAHDFKREKRRPRMRRFQSLIAFAAFAITLAPIRTSAQAAKDPILRDETVDSIGDGVVADVLNVTVRIKCSFCFLILHFQTHIAS